jgi:hypothetical protein
MDSRRCTITILTMLVFAASIPAIAPAQTPAPRTALDQLVQQAVEQIRLRYQRPLGSVAERRRDRVFVLLRQAPPAAGARLEVVRSETNGGERVVARLEVLSTEAGLTECRQVERIARAQSQPGDIVRIPLGSTRLLIAPCIALADVPQEIPDVVGERIRVALLSATFARVKDDGEAERRAEAAYFAGTVGEFAARQRDADEVLFPVLLATPGKLVLNLEYVSAERGRTTEIDVASVAQDDILRAWLRAGRVRMASPPGFKRLPAQEQRWRVVGLAEASAGNLLVLEADSVFVLEFYHPGLRRRAAVALGPRQRARRAPWSTVIPPRVLEGVSPELPLALHVLSDERRPQAVQWSPASTEPLMIRPAPAPLEEALEKLWNGIRPTSRRQEARWWPAPGQSAQLIAPCFGDFDLDGRLDAAWSALDGGLQWKLASARGARSFNGFGDVKAVHPARSAGGRATLWLTDPVWHQDQDRLHAAQIVGDELQVQWTSEPFEGTLVALASLDLNADGLLDLVGAEERAAGVRLHTFIAYPGDRGRNPNPEASGRP